MATRFYLPSSGAPGVTPPALPSGWSDGSPASYAAPAPTTKTDTALADFTITETVNTVSNIAAGVFVSEPLAAQEISGDVTAVVGGLEAASSSDDSLNVGVYLIEGDGSAVLSELYPGHTAALLAQTATGQLGQEIDSAVRESRIIPAQTLTTQTAAAGNRLMILVGYRTHDVSATARITTLRLGDPAAGTDFPLTSDLTDDSVPWVELSATLTFAGGGASDLDVDNLAQAQALGEPALTQVGVLAVANLAQAQVIASPALTQVSTLAVDPIAQAQTIGNVTLSVGQSLSVDGIAQNQVMGAPALVAVGVLAVDSIAQAQVIGSPVLQLISTLAVDDVVQLQAIADVILSGDDVPVDAPRPPALVRASLGSDGPVIAMAPTTREAR